MAVGLVLAFAGAFITPASAGEHDHPTRTRPTTPDGKPPPPVVDRLWNDLVCLCGRCERLTLATCACEDAANERRNILELIEGHDLSTPRDEQAAYDRVIESYVARFGRRVLATARDRDARSDATPWWLAPVGITGRPRNDGDEEVASLIEEEQRKAAEAAWQTRQAQLAKDRAAREAAMRKAQEERAATRERRRAERLGELQARWQRAFLADPETQDELTLHAQRVAELARAKEVAEVAANGKLVVRIGVAQAREDERHQQRMAALETSFKARGGQP